jgi:hypothetical protein
VQAPEDHGEDQEGQADHHRRELGHLAVEDLGRVLTEGGVAAEVDRQGGAGLRPGNQDPDPVNQTGGLGLLGPVVGNTTATSALPLGLSRGGWTLATRGSCCSEATKAAERAWSVGPVSLTGNFGASHAQAAPRRRVSNSDIQLAGTSRPLVCEPTPAIRDHPPVAIPDLPDLEVR